MEGNKFKTPDMMARCVPMASLQAVLGGKWKILILWYVAFYKVQRFGQLLRRLDGITQSSLTRQLPSIRALARDLGISVITTKRAYEELERDGFLHREVYGEVPPRVEYSLTEMGRSFQPILEQMLQWSAERLCPPDSVKAYELPSSPNADESSVRL